MKNLALMCVLLLLPSTFVRAESDEKISKIDGQLVPVGEKNNYEKDYPKINVGMNVFLLPADIFSASASYAFHDNLAARVGFISSHHKDSSYSSVNAGLPIYFKKVYNGFFVEPGYDTHSKFYTAGGYHWMWDSGLNLFVGAGAAKHGGMGYLQMAYAFGK